MVEDNPTDVMLIRRAFDKAKLANPFRSSPMVTPPSITCPVRERTPIAAVSAADSDPARPQAAKRSGLEVVEWLRRRRRSSAFRS